jgi:Tfp pilus assembly protein PilO
MKIENRQQWLIVLTIAAMALLIGDRVVLGPMAHWWKTRAATITELRHQVKEGKLLIQREAAIRSRWDLMRTNTLPNNTSLAEEQVFKAFYGWERESGVSITDTTPQWKNDTDDYLTLNCRVEASGTLATLSRFLYDIEKGPLALKLDSVELSSRDNTGQQLILSLQVSGLALVSQTQPKP